MQRRARGALDVLGEVRAQAFEIDAVIVVSLTTVSVTIAARRMLRRADESYAVWAMRLSRGATGAPLPRG